MRSGIIKCLNLLEGKEPEEKMPGSDHTSLGQVRKLDVTLNTVKHVDTNKLSMFL